MAVKRVLIVVLTCISLVLISGCQNVQHNRIVPVDTGSSSPFTQSPVESSSNISSKRLTPTPPVVFTLTKRAYASMQMQQWDASQKALEQALRIAPSEPQVFLAYGDFYYNQNNYSQAQQMFFRVISLAGEGSSMGKLAQARLQSMVE